jgi:glycosyltransferase involved in cell wall biosynthesis
MIPDEVTPRRVLMSAGTAGDGWTYALDLARGLGELGIATTLATMGGLPTEEQQREAARLPLLDLRPSTYKLEWMDDPWEEVAAAGEWLLALEEEVHPHIVHLNQYTHGGLPFATPVVVVGHGCALSWWEAVRGERAPPEWGRYREEVRRGLGGADAVVTASRAMMEALRRQYGEFGPGRVVPHGHHTAAPEVEEKEPFVLSVGARCDGARNVLGLEAVAEELPWPVYAAGEHAHGEGDAAPARLHHLGPLSPRELAGWYARAAIFALPARYEPFGLSVLEAGLGGCALVLGDIASLREGWEDAALFVPPGDGGALARTLQALMADGERRGEMALRARARAGQFTPRRMVEGYLAVYREVRREGHARRLRRAA